MDVGFFWVGKFLGSFWGNFVKELWRLWGSFGGQFEQQQTLSDWVTCELMSPSENLSDLMSLHRTWETSKRCLMMHFQHIHLQHLHSEKLLLESRTTDYNWLQVIDWLRCICTIFSLPFQRNLRWKTVPPDWASTIDCCCPHPTWTLFGLRFLQHLHQTQPPKEGFTRSDGVLHVTNRIRNPTSLGFFGGKVHVQPCMFICSSIFWRKQRWCSNLKKLHLMNELNPCNSWSIESK